MELAPRRRPHDAGVTDAAEDLSLESLTITPRKPTTFHPFPRLPTELRLMIWEMAVRPRASVRALEYFTVYQAIGDNIRTPLNELAIATSVKSQWPCAEVLVDTLKAGRKPIYLPLNITRGLSAPRVRTAHAAADDNPPQFSWFKGNPSLYTWDAGLLSASRESRAVVTAALGRSNRADAQSWARTPFQFRDAGRALVCLEYDPQDREYQFHMRRESWDLLFSTCLDRWFQGPSPGRVNDLAFQFDPSWLEGLPGEDEPFDIHKEKSPRGFFASAFNSSLPSNVRIWLIDRTLEVPQEVAERYKRENTHYMWSDVNDTFVQVGRNDLFRRNRKSKKSRAEHLRHTSFYLIYRLEEERRAWLAGWNYSFIFWPGPGHVGVLARMPRESLVGWHMSPH